MQYKAPTIMGSGEDMSRAALQANPLRTRPALLTCLEAHRTGLATLIEAGAGYGKSTMLQAFADALEQRGNAVITLDLDRARGDPQVFLSVLRRACDPMLPQAIAADANAQPGAFSALAEQLSAAPPVSILIDHYDRAENTELDQALADFARRLTPNVHLVFASRKKIQIPFGWRRLGKGIAKLDLESLRFSDQEISEMFAGRLTPAEVVELRDWSEGWPVAVQFARAHIGQGARGDEKISAALSRAGAEIEDYINDEILRPLAPAQLKLLVEMSFLESFSGEMAEAVTDVRDAWRILEPLRSSNILMLQRVGEDRRYRCHRLLRQTLYAALRRRGKRAIAERRRAAAIWLRRNGDPIAAIAQAHAADDTELVASLVLDLDATMFGVSHGAAELRAIMDQVPAEALAHSPRLALAQAYLAAKASDVETAMEIVRGVRRETPLANDPLLARDLAIAEAAIATYDGRGLGSSSLQAIEQIETCHGDIDTRAFVNNLRGINAVNTSDFPEAIARFGSAMHFYAQQHSLNGLGYSNLHLGRIYAEMGDTTKALSHYRESRRYFTMRSTGDDRSLGAVALFMAQSLYDRGDVDEALNQCRSVEKRAELGGCYAEALYAGYRTLALINTLIGAAPDSARDLDSGIRFAHTKRFARLEHLLTLEKTLLSPAHAGDSAPIDEAHTEDEPWRVLDLRAMASAERAMERDDAEAALKTLQTRARLCAERGRIRTQIDLLVRIALIHARTKQRENALESLRQATALAWRGAVLSPFFEKGMDVVALLTTLAASASFKRADPGEIAFVNDAIRLCQQLRSRAVAIFSARELEVLHHLARGLNNKLIARALNISPETVRFHLKAIYQKFGISHGYANRRVIAGLAAEHDVGARS